MATKWGVCGTGNICHDFVTAVRSLKSSDHQFVSIAGRRLESAQVFADKHEISRAYGSYEELAKDPNVEVVYIGTVTSSHYSLAKLMLENGKHVLVETAFTINTKQTEELFSLAKSKKLFAMEALWPLFLPSYEFVFKQIRKGVIGDVYHVNASLGFNIAEFSELIKEESKTQTLEDRMGSKETGGGTILDLAIFVIHIAEQAFNGETPTKVKAVGHLNQNGVDLDFSAALEYANQRTATVSAHSLVQLPNEAVIVGTKGTIRLGLDPHSMTKVYVNDKLHEFKYPEPVLPLVYGSVGLCYQVHEVRKCILEGKSESDRLSHSDSVTIAKIEDEIRRQIGVVFDVD